MICDSQWCPSTNAVMAARRAVRSMVWEVGAASGGTTAIATATATATTIIIICVITMFLLPSLVDQNLFLLFQLSSWLPLPNGPQIQAIWLRKQQNFRLKISLKYHRNLIFWKHFQNILTYWVLYSHKETKQNQSEKEKPKIKQNKQKHPHPYTPTHTTLFQRQTDLSKGGHNFIRHFNAKIILKYHIFPKYFYFR